MPITGTDRRYDVHQTSVAINQANPTSGTQYALLPLTTYVCIFQIATYVVWTDQPTPLEVNIVADTINRLSTINNPVSTQSYFYNIVAQNEPGNLISLAQAISRYLQFRSKSASVTCEITGGTVQTLFSRLKYARYI